MASIVFVELFQQAVKRDHAKMVQVRAIVEGTGLTDMLAATRLAGSLQSLGNQIDEQLLATARSNRMRIRKLRYRCPLCHQPDCLMAQPLTFIGQVVAYKLHLLEGGDPHEYFE